MHAEQQRGLSTASVEIELMTSVRAVSVSDLETVPVERLSFSSVPAGCEGVADQFALVARSPLDREFQWGFRGIHARKNLGAALFECLFDADDDIAST